MHRHRHVAILEYLRDMGDTFGKTIDVFMEEAKLRQETVPSGSGLLEKKWCVTFLFRL